PRRLPRLGLERRGGLHRHARRTRHQRAGDAGARAAAAAQAEALLGQLPPARARAAAAARAAAGVGGRRRGARLGRPGLADRGLARARGLGHDGDPLPRPPEPRADPDARGLGGSSAAQGLPRRRRAGALLGGGVVATVERPPVVWRGTPPYEGSRIPTPIPTVLQVDPSEHELEDVLTVNFGPNHPSTHGVLRLIVDLDGEHVAGIAAVVGYLHTGFEKTMEQKTWWKCMTYPERIDYVSYLNNGLVFVLAVEKLLGIEVPRKATWMRMCMAEINRLHSHLIWLGTSALEIGAISMLWYAFREREKTVELSELVGGTRMHTRYFQAGGLAEDVPPGFFPVCRDFCRQMRQGIDDYDTILTSNKIWLERTEGIGLLSADDAIALGQSGPVARASGIDWDLRRDQPYLAYDEVDFVVPVYRGGDVYDRYRVHMDEMRQSVRIIEQCLDRLE